MSKYVLIILLTISSSKVLAQVDNTITNTWGELDPLQLNVAFVGSNVDANAGVITSLSSSKVLGVFNTSNAAAWGSFSFTQSHNQSRLNSRAFGAGFRVSRESVSLPSDASFHKTIFSVPISVSFSALRDRSRTRNPRFAFALQFSTISYSQTLSNSYTNIAFVSGYGSGNVLIDPIFTDRLRTPLGEIDFGFGMYANNYSWGLQVDNLTRLFNEDDDLLQVVSLPISSIRLHGSRKTEAGAEFGGLAQFSQLNVELLGNLGYSFEGSSSTDNSFEVKGIFGINNNRSTKNNSIRFGVLSAYHLGYDGLSIFLGGDLLRTQGIYQSRVCVGITYNRRAVGNYPDNRSHIW